MSVTVYDVFKKAIPELNQQASLNSEDFYDFLEWMNETDQFFHYFEPKEYYDNGIEDNYYFNKFNVDTEKLQSAIDAKINQLLEAFDGDSESVDDQVDALEQIEEIIFNIIQNAAKSHQLSLLVIYRENPYWLVVPTQDDEQLNGLVSYFNEIFNQDSDLNMAVY